LKEINHFLRDIDPLSDLSVKIFPMWGTLGTLIGGSFNSDKENYEKINIDLINIDGGEEYPVLTWKEMSSDVKWFVYFRSSIHPMPGKVEKKVNIEFWQKDNRLDNVSMEDKNNNVIVLINYKEGAK